MIQSVLRTDAGVVRSTSRVVIFDHRVAAGALRVAESSSLCRTASSTVFVAFYDQQIKPHRKLRRHTGMMAF